MKAFAIFVTTAFLVVLVKYARSQSFSCAAIKCPSFQVCQLIEIECTAMPCPKLPQCVSPDSDNHQTDPVDDNNSKITISDMFDMPGNNDSLNYDTVGMNFPIQFENNNTSETIFKNECKVCLPMLCMMVSCPGDPSARCEIQECTCEVTYINLKGYPANCNAEISATLPGDKKFLPNSTTVWVPETTTTVFQTEQDTSTSIAQENYDAKTLIIIVFGAIFAVIIFVSIVYVVFKMQRAKSDKMKKNKKLDEEQGEPLQSLSENNNKHISSSPASTNNTDSTQLVT